jgi:hypothetical protein
MTTVHIEAEMQVQMRPSRPDLRGDLRLQRLYV